MDELTLPQRIQSIYKSCNDKEKAYLRTILQELSATGHSETYEKIWLADYKEIPVDIDTFIESDLYLGTTNQNGKAVYPYWRKVLREIFSAGNKFEECFFTGATRIGKSSTAITATIYMLYRLMCLKDPQKYFGKKEVSKFSILFFNITKELARGVGFREFNDTLRESKWFQIHGKFSLSDRNYYYIPEGGKVVIDYGSDAAHALGQQVFVGFCLVGNTKVITRNGLVTLEELSKQSESTEIMSYNTETCTVEWSKFKCAKKTKDCELLAEIILDDGTSIQGTLEHQLLTASGQYTTLGDIHVGSKIDVVHTTGKSYIQVRSKLVRALVTPVPVYDVIGVEKNHNFIIYGNTCNIVSHNCDEINFSKAGVKDVSKAKEHMQDLYNTISARVKGTFRMDGEVYGKIFAVSSKRSDSDFMEIYMQQQLQAGAGDHMYIADKPQWEVLPPSMFSKETFTIAVGDRHNRGFVVPDGQDFPEALEELKSQGYILLHPPIDMKSNFLADFDIALRDMAGISVPGSLSYITQDLITQCIGGRRNPFYSDILEIGTNDNLTIEEFFHMEVVDRHLINRPVYIHLDLSLNDDKTGITAVCISGSKDVKDSSGTTIAMPMFSHLFSISLKAPRGANIPYDKITSFIVWLRSQGFNIRGISRDQFQSEYMGQLLEAKGFGKIPKVSLDRTPDGYQALRSTLAEKRIDLLHVELLEQELIHLQRDSVSGKVDHPIGGSKDIADTLAGSVWNAICQNPGVVVPPTTVASAIQSINGALRTSGPDVMSSIFGLGNKINPYSRR